MIGSNDSQGSFLGRPSPKLFMGSAIPAIALALLIFLVLSHLKTAQDDDAVGGVEEIKAVNVPLPPPPEPPSDKRIVQPENILQLPMDLSPGDIGVPLPPASFTNANFPLDGRPAASPHFDFAVKEMRDASFAINAPGHVYQTSEVDRQPEMVYRSNPRMKESELTKTFRHEGRTVLLFIIEPDGTAKEIHVVETSGSSEVDAAWVEATRKSKFRPAVRDGKPVRCWAQMSTLRICMNRDRFSL